MYTHVQSTTDVSGTKYIKPQNSPRNFSYQLETALKDNSFKPVNDTVHHHKRNESNFQLNEFNNPFPSQKTPDVCRVNLSNETRNPMQVRIPAKYTFEQNTADVSGAKNQSQYSLRNFSCPLETPLKDNSFKQGNDAIQHNKRKECNSQILDRFNKPFPLQKTADCSSFNSFSEISNSLQTRIENKLDRKDIKPQYTKNESLKSVIDVVHPNQQSECSSQISDEIINPGQKMDVNGLNLPKEIRNHLQDKISEKYVQQVNQTSSKIEELDTKDYEDATSQYSLRNFTCKLEATPKDKRFKPRNDVVHHNQWTECSYQIFDEFNNPLCLKKTSLADVSSSSQYVEFRDIKIKKDHLHFKMKSIQTGNISVLIKIDNFALTKDFCVTFNPCSSSLSDMTIEKINPVEEEFVYRLFIFDVFGEPVPLNSTATLELDASFPSDENKVVSKVKRIEQEQVCYDIAVRGNRPWSRDLIVLLNGKQVNHAREFEFTNEECNAINDLDDDDYEWIQKIFPERDCEIFIPLTTGHDDGMFVAYNENDCELQSQNAKDHQLICKNVRKHDILGEDFAHIDNIRRVLEIKDRVEIEPTDSHAIIHLRNIRPHLRPICKEVVQHLLRGLYYRRKASEAARIRMEWKNRLISIDEI